MTTHLTDALIIWFIGKRSIINDPNMHKMQVHKDRQKASYLRRMRGKGSKLKCGFCDKQFPNTTDGLVEKTFHEILHEGENK